MISGREKVLGVAYLLWLCVNFSLTSILLFSIGEHVRP